MKNIARALILLLFMGCNKEDSRVQITNSDVQFTFNVSDGVVGRTLSNSTEPKEVIITIKDENGLITHYREHIELLDFNGALLSSPLTLPVGNFTLEEFFILNEEKEILYVSPLEGSEKASLVKEPLAISFDVSEDKITTVSPEVIHAAGSPESYGFAQFEFKVVRVEVLTISVFSITGDGGLNLTNAHLKIAGFDEEGDVIWEESIELESTANQICVRESYSYGLIISKDGFKTEELQIADEDSRKLEVILQETCEELDFKTVWSKEISLEGTSVYTVSGYKMLDDGILISLGLTNANYTNELFLKVDSDGNELWKFDPHRFFGQSVKKYLAVSDGGIVIMGYGVKGSDPAHLMKIGINGEIQWDLPIGTGHNMNAIQSASEDEFWFSADGPSSLVDGRRDFKVFKADLHGNTVEILSIDNSLYNGIYFRSSTASGFSILGNRRLGNNEFQRYVMNFDFDGNFIDEYKETVISLNHIRARLNDGTWLTGSSEQMTDCGEDVSCTYSIVKRLTADVQSEIATTYLDVPCPVYDELYSLFTGIFPMENGGALLSYITSDYPIGYELEFGDDIAKRSHVIAEFDATSNMIIQRDKIPIQSGWEKGYHGYAWYVLSLAKGAIVPDQNNGYYRLFSTDEYALRIEKISF
ncbi:MAG: hypothetical protein ABJG47_14580 [Ekhidna sp.]